MTRTEVQEEDEQPREQFAAKRAALKIGIYLGDEAPTSTRTNLELLLGDVESQAPKLVARELLVEMPKDNHPGHMRRCLLLTVVEALAIAPHELVSERAIAERAVAVVEHSVMLAEMTFGLLAELPTPERGRQRSFRHPSEQVLLSRAVLARLVSMASVGQAFSDEARRAVLTESVEEVWARLAVSAGAEAMRRRSTSNDKIFARSARFGWSEVSRSLTNPFERIDALEADRDKGTPFDRAVDATFEARRVTDRNLLSAMKAMAITIQARKSASYATRHGEREAEVDDGDFKVNKVVAVDETHTSLGNDSLLRRLDIAISRIPEKAERYDGLRLALETIAYIESSTSDAIGWLQDAFTASPIADEGRSGDDDDDGVEIEFEEVFADPTGGSRPASKKFQLWVSWRVIWLVEPHRLVHHGEGARPETHKQAVSRLHEKMAVLIAPELVKAKKASSKSTISSEVVA